MIRTKENRISGPFPKEEVLARIVSGELREADEICPAGGYWIFLHEREESVKILGVALPRADDMHEEVTETDTPTPTATTTQPFTEGEAAEEKKMEVAREAAKVSAAEKLAADLQTAQSGRPERMTAIRLLVWVLLVALGFILFRVFATANLS